MIPLLLLNPVLWAICAYAMWSWIAKSQPNTPQTEGDRP